jgi:hypothetical protein
MFLCKSASRPLLDFGVLNDNMYSQTINSPILKNLCQVKQEKHMNKKLNINLIHHLWIDLDQERIDQVQHLSIGYLCEQLDHKKKVFKE